VGHTKASDEGAARRGGGLNAGVRRLDSDKFLPKSGIMEACVKIGRNLTGFR
jgi:hypothetical protein